MRRWSIIFLLAAMLFGVWSPSQAKSKADQFFPETGHWVRGEFLEYFNSVPDPLLVFGYPITEVFTDPTINIDIQYFQRARFELHADAPSGQRVQLSPVGAWVFRASEVEAVSLETDTPACRPYTYKNNNFHVCYAFKNFFDAHGGLAQFGAPISDFSREGDRYIQYFERARFEWRPDLPPDQWVRLADIARIQFDQSQRDPALLTSAEAGNLDRIGSSIIRLQPRAFMSKAVARSRSEQTIFVIVQDQKQLPVENALVAIEVQMPGKMESYRLPATDQDGITRFTFTVDDLPVNQIVPVEVTVSYGDIESTTSTWFRIWW